ncbi:hypothetical protein PAAG_02218 [Paracoccidioides lutzii Pb01]|uniref:Uncharacterized protein n=1 Tax=Paracoccidioides lutzii (strain ATCC MYA-826 / Pb01) TaxID=502779 RepID=C1GVE1_PARBA|nr:hypothetical protein PAAG_02218 [Paracoccidioides lutzii Pb01]EEH40163.1 hypothetical protein PAAG_02218 [Paracoccidioides lutzii Pb01]
MGNKVRQEREEVRKKAQEPKAVNRDGTVKTNSHRAKQTDLQSRLQHPRLLWQTEQAAEGVRKARTRRGQDKVKRLDHGQPRCPQGN